ncbi:MAG: ATP-binding protein [Candidatus Nanoarchaeia archaeon]|nr:ATP-binding protein [Candidatus Nanoarchaeia archaeon]
MRVYIKEGVSYGQVINGEFEVVRDFVETRFIPNGNSDKDGKIFVNINGKSKGIWVNMTDFHYTDREAVNNNNNTDSSNIEETADIVNTKKETPSEMIERISSRFNVMNIMTDGIIYNSIKSLIISAAPGVGKTYGVETKLEKAHEDGIIQKYTFIKGQCSPIGLYMSLWEHKDEGNVLVFDDADSVFYDDVALNILKAALDSGLKRVISWNTVSKALEEADIPNRFEFNGTVVFISNLNFDKMISKGNKLAPHLSALVSRSIYLDLGVHEAEEILIRINHVIMNTDMIDNLNLEPEQISEMVDWINDNATKLRSLSLRTVLQVANFIKTSSSGWKEIAKVTLFKPSALWKN